MTIFFLKKVQVNMSRKKVMQNERGCKKSTFNNVCLNTFRLCKPSKLILRWRYVNMNIKTKGLSSMLTIS